MLILGASGGVGTGCVQIAKNLKARVIACASSPDKLKRLKELGADHVIDYTKEDFSKRAWEISGKQGVDVLVNYTGGDTWVPSLRTLAKHGRLLTCGATAGFDPKTDIRYIWRREVNIIGANGWTREDLEALLRRGRARQHQADHRPRLPARRIRRGDAHPPGPRSVRQGDRHPVTVNVGSTAAPLGERAG